MLNKIILLMVVNLTVSSALFAAETTGWIKRFRIEVSTNAEIEVNHKDYFVLVTGENEGYVLTPAFVDQRPGRLRTKHSSSTAGISALENHRVTVIGDSDTYTGEGRDFGHYKILDAILVESYRENIETSLSGKLERVQRVWGNNIIQNIFKKTTVLKTEDGRELEFSGFDTSSLDKRDIKKGRYYLNLEGSFSGEKFEAKKAHLTLLQN